MTCLKSGYLNNFISSKLAKKVVNEKQVNLKYFVTLIFYKHDITREKKRFKYTTTWFVSKLVSYIFILHNVISLKTAIMWHCFSCKNKQWILIRRVSCSFQAFLMKPFCKNILGILFCFLQLEYLLTKSIFTCIKKGYVKMNLSEFLVKIYDYNTITLL